MVSVVGIFWVREQGIVPNDDDGGDDNDVDGDSEVNEQSERKPRAR
jgi:hypothetical protein